jgi:hypothetical protein
MNRLLVDGILDHRPEAIRACKGGCGGRSLATILPNEASLLRLASAVLSEISDDWETERAYLTMEAR